MYRLRAKRTTGSEPPADMLYGELAYSDGNQQLYIGRPTGPPATFQSDLTSITGDIDALATTTSDQALEIAALAVSDQAQDTVIASLILSDSTQDTVIDGLVNDAIGLSGEIATLGTTTTAALALKLEPDDIASFETTTQLNARDTAARSRANHTGTQAAATVTGLAPVATTGAYGDLSGKPTINGFTYDQQAEPSGPAAGATWRERTSGGLIIGQWEWLSSFSEWVSLATYDLNSDFGIGSTSSASVGTRGCISIKRLILSRTITALKFSGADFTTSNFHVFTPQLKTITSGGVGNLVSATLDTNSLNNLAAVNSIYTFAEFSLFRAVTGIPGQSRVFLSLKVRDCRS